MSVDFSRLPAPRAALLGRSGAVRGTKEKDNNMCIYNLHLGLINAPPPDLFFPPNGLFHYSFTIKKVRNILNSGQDFINLTGDTGWPSWGSSWGSSIFSQSETPPKVISCTYKVFIKRNTF